MKIAVYELSTAHLSQTTYTNITEQMYGVQCVPWFGEPRKIIFLDPEATLSPDIPHDLMLLWKWSIKNKSPYIVLSGAAPKIKQLLDYSDFWK